MIAGFFNNRRFSYEEKGQAQGIAEWVIRLSAIIAVMSGRLLMQVMNWQQANEFLVYGLLVALGLNLFSWIRSVTDNVR